MQLHHGKWPVKLSNRYFVVTTSVAALDTRGFKLPFVVVSFSVLCILICILKACLLFLFCVCVFSSDFITCKALMPGGAPLHSSVLRTGAVTGLWATSRGELPLSVPRRPRRAMLQQSLPRRDKKPRQDSQPYQWSSTADRQKPAGIKILLFALPFLAFHFLLHWEFFWE